MTSYEFQCHAQCRCELRFICFVGGLAEEVDEKTLRAAFLPFGEVTDVQIPLDPESKSLHASLLSAHDWLSGSLTMYECRCDVFIPTLSHLPPAAPKHRGFGFVEFELPEVGVILDQSLPLLIPPSL